jgi:hypothetical protein
MAEWFEQKTYGYGGTHDERWIRVALGQRAMTRDQRQRPVSIHSSMRLIGRTQIQPMPAAV